MKQILTAVIALIITTSSFAQTGVKKKCNIIMVNPCHWWLASKTFTIMGYVLINDGNTSYFTLNGEEIDQSKTPVLDTADCREGTVEINVITIMKQ